MNVWCASPPLSPSHWRPSGEEEDVPFLIKGPMGNGGRRWAGVNDSSAVSMSVVSVCVCYAVSMGTSLALPDFSELLFQRPWTSSNIRAVCPCWNFCQTGDLSLL
jgi:hypothetical protein